MEKTINLTESLESCPRSHMVNRLIFNGVTDADILINATDSLLDFIGESGLFDRSTPQERSLSNWRGLMVNRLISKGLSDADLIISTTNKLHDFLISKKKEDQQKTLESFNAQQGT